jgi:hypothetical protein
VKKSLAITLAAIALGTAVPALAGQGLPCSFQDLMPAYGQFATATAGLPPAERGARFITDVAARYPDYYAPEIFGDADKLRSRAQRFFDPAGFPGAPRVSEAQLAAMGAAVGPQFTEQQQRFMRTFSDFRCETTVEFGVSLLMFDGHPVAFGGKQHLLFGVDVIAGVHTPADMGSFFDHELFHLYHAQVVGDQAPGDEVPAWWTLWVEGLATYVSQRMNPGLDAQQVLWYPPDMVARMQGNRARAASLFLQDLDKSGKDADRWFLAGTSVAGLPQRCGYYLGYLFARSEAGHRSLPQLARLSPQQVHRDAAKFLSSLAAAATATAH